jgi:Protein of unknown function (DUF2501)
MPALNTIRLAALSTLILLPFTAQAQLLDQLKGAVGQSGASAIPGLPSVDQASPSNTAGVLQYCVRNNIVSGASASSVKDSILSKVTGSGHGANDAGFKAGNDGVLQTGSGQGYSLGGSGIKAQATQKVCDLVLQHAKSLL